MCLTESPVPGSHVESVQPASVSMPGSFHIVCLANREERQNHEAGRSFSGHGTYPCLQLILQRHFMPVGI